MLNSGIKRIIRQIILAIVFVLSSVCFNLAYGVTNIEEFNIDPGYIVYDEFNQGFVLNFYGADNQKLYQCSTLIYYPKDNIFVASGFIDDNIEMWMFFPDECEIHTPNGILIPSTDITLEYWIVDPYDKLTPASPYSLILYEINVNNTF